MSEFKPIVEVLLRIEGGYVDAPDDPGGATKYGISQRSYPELDIASLSREQAIAIYRRDWWDKYMFGRINHPDIAREVFLFAVHAGAKKATSSIQCAINMLCDDDTEPVSLVVDGILGRRTVAALNHQNIWLHQRQHLLALYALEQIRHYHETSRSRFLRGHIARALGYTERSTTGA